MGTDASEGGAGAGGPPLPSRLGRYQVLRRISQGGMAEILLACVHGTQGFTKPVVIKRILPQRAANREYVRMFLDEARVVAALDHPNIVQVHDIGKAEGEYFLAMECLEGEDVSALMRTAARKERKLPLGHALHIVAGVCAGLHYAHERVGLDGAPLSIVHRDISPENVFVTYNGDVKLVDFGIAKSAVQLARTMQGMLKGKLAYMSPEQVRGREIDRRSDIFSTAALLWELTTGRRLVRGRGDVDIMRAICEEDAPPPSAFAPDYPRDLERVVLRGLRREPDERYPTAQALQLDLEEFARENKVGLSAVGLAQLMAELFDASVEARLKTYAETGGSFSRHVADTLGGEGDDGPPAPSAPPEAASSQTVPTAPYRKAVHPATERSGQPDHADPDAAPTAARPIPPDQATPDAEHALPEVEPAADSGRVTLAVVPASERAIPAVQAAPASERAIPAIQAAPDSGRAIPAVQAAPASERAIPAIQAAPASERAIPAVRVAPDSRRAIPAGPAPAPAPSPAVAPLRRGLRGVTLLVALFILAVIGGAIAALVVLNDQAASSTHHAPRGVRPAAKAAAPRRPARAPVKAADRARGTDHAESARPGEPLRARSAGQSPAGARPVERPDPRHEESR